MAQRTGDRGRTALWPDGRVPHRRGMTMIDPPAIPFDATWFGSGLSAASRETLSSFAREYEAPARTRLLREGDETRELSVLLSGRVALTEHVAGRGTITLMTVEPGDIFGWSAVIKPYTATSTVTSLEPVRVVAFDASRLRAAIRTDCGLAAGIYPKVLEVLARRLGATRTQLLDLYGAGNTEPW